MDTKGNSYYTDCFNSQKLDMPILNLDYTYVSPQKLFYGYKMFLINTFRKLHFCSRTMQKNVIRMSSQGYQGQVAGSCEYGNEPSSSIKCREFFD
jgi:hypothetical protein